VKLEGGVSLVGLGSWRAGDSHPEAAFASVDPRAPTLVLAHNFQSLNAPSVGRFDLAMVGHTHAGQACVPFTELCPFLEYDMKPYRYGLYEWPAGGRLYVTSGLGTSGVRARLGARPEIAIIDLVPE
jgi:predicted MPP superfamily phosphohydrolase